MSKWGKLQVWLGPNVKKKKKTTPVCTSMANKLTISFCLFKPCLIGPELCPSGTQTAECGSLPGGRCHARSYKRPLYMYSWHLPSAQISTVHQLRPAAAVKTTEINSHVSAERGCSYCVWNHDCGDKCAASHERQSCAEVWYPNEKEREGKRANISLGPLSQQKKHSGLIHHHAKPLPSSGINYPMTLNLD